MHKLPATTTGKRQFVNVLLFKNKCNVKCNGGCLITSNAEDQSIFEMGWVGIYHDPLITCQVLFGVSQIQGPLTIDICRWQKLFQFPQIKFGEMTIVDIYGYFPSRALYLDTLLCCYTFSHFHTQLTFTATHVPFSPTIPTQIIG